jgi:hypothetical protein
MAVPNFSSAFFRINDPINRYDLDDIVHDIDQKYGVKVSIIEEDRVKITPSAEEKKRKEREYRRTYRQRENVKKRILENQQDPGHIEKRKKYAAQTCVKEKKRRSAKARRQTLSALERDMPSVVERYRQEAAKAVIALELEEMERQKKQEQLSVSEESSHSDTEIIPQVTPSQSQENESSSEDNEIQKEEENIGQT